MGVDYEGNFIGHDEMAVVMRNLIKLSVHCRCIRVTLITSIIRMDCEWRRAFAIASLLLQHFPANLYSSEWLIQRLADNLNGVPSTVLIEL